MQFEILFTVVGLLLVYLHLYFHVFLHEFGHALLSRIVGFEVMRFRIGTGWCWYKSRRILIGMFPLSGGVTLKQEPENHPKEYIFIALGGVLATSTVAAICNFIWWHNMPDNLILNYIWMMFFLLLYFDITNLLPLKGKDGSLSDGAVILGCIQKLWKQKRGMP